MAFSDDDFFLRSSGKLWTFNDYGEIYILTHDEEKDNDAIGGMNGQMFTFEVEAIFLRNMWLEWIQNGPQNPVDIPPIPDHVPIHLPNQQPPPMDIDPQIPAHNNALLPPLMRAV